MLLTIFTASNKKPYNDLSPCSSGLPECHSNCSHTGTIHLFLQCRMAVRKKNTMKHGVTEKKRKIRKKIASCCAGERARLSSSDALLHPCPSIPGLCHAHHPSPARRFLFCPWTPGGTFHKIPSLALPHPLLVEGVPPPAEGPPEVRTPQHPQPGAWDQAHQLRLHRRGCCSRGTQVASSKTGGEALTVKEPTALLVIPTREGKTMIISLSNSYSTWHGQPTQRRPSWKPTSPQTCYPTLHGLWPAQNPPFAKRASRVMGSFLTLPFLGIRKYFQVAYHLCYFLLQPASASSNRFSYSFGQWRPHNLFIIE